MAENPTVQVAKKRLSYLVRDLEGVGTTVQAFTACAGLAERGHDVELVVVKREGLLADETPKGLRIVELLPTSGVNGSIRTTRAVVALARHLRARRPEVLWSGAKGANSLALWAQRISGVSPQLVLSITNDLYHRSSPEDRGRQLSVFMIRVAYGRADKVITLSQGMTDHLIDEEGLPAELMSIIPPPIDVARIRSLGREPVDHPWLQAGGPPVVLNVARMAPQKDQSTLLKAFAEATDSRPDLRLIIVGDSSEEPRRALLAEAELLGVADKVDLVGFDANPYRYMTRAAVFALSSLWEGFGIVLAEAMACGCPVVAVDCPYGPSEILLDGQAGAVVPMWDPGALAKGIVHQVVAPTAQDVLAKRARDFDIPAVMNRYDGVLQELAG